MDVMSGDPELPEAGEPIDPREQKNVRGPMVQVGENYSPWGGSTARMLPIL